MADNSAGRLGLMAVVGFLLIEVGLTGRLGSLLGAIIDPNSMTEQNQGGGTGGHNGSSTGLGSNSNLPQKGTLTPGQIGAYAINAGFGASSLQVAIAVALAESGGRIGATNQNTNGSTDYGLWQINSIHGYSPTSLLTPAYNAQAAYDISNGGTNWHPWTTYQTGAYLAYMATAQQGAIEAAAYNVGA